MQRMSACWHYECMLLQWNINPTMCYNSDELGPGKGALTRPLLAAYPQMTGVEIDERSVKLLREELPSLRLLQGDMLALDLAAMAAERGGALSVISNTPFYLTSPLLFRLLASGGAVGRAVLTMQKEVGEKVLAPHGCKQYGILSVMLQLFAQPEAVFDIPPAAFRPMPKCRPIGWLRCNNLCMPP